MGLLLELSKERSRHLGCPGFTRHLVLRNRTWHLSCQEGVLLWPNVSLSSLNWREIRFWFLENPELSFLPDFPFATQILNLFLLRASA